MVFRSSVISRLREAKYLNLITDQNLVVITSQVLKVMAGLCVALVGLRLPDACIPSLSAFNHDGDVGGDLIIRQSKN